MEHATVADTGEVPMLFPGSKPDGGDVRSEEMCDNSLILVFEASHFSTHIGKSHILLVDDYRADPNAMTVIVFSSF